MSATSSIGSHENYLWEIDSTNQERANQLTRFGESAFFHNIDLLRRNHDEGTLQDFPELGKLAVAFGNFLREMEIMRANTPCIVGRFRCDKSIGILSTIDSQNFEGASAAFAEAKSNNQKAFPLYGVDKICEEQDAQTGDTHVSIEKWLETYGTERVPGEDFYRYSLRKLTSRLECFTNLFLEINANREDLERVLSSDAGGLLAAHTVARGLLSHRFSFASSPWKPTDPFETLAKSIREKGPHILYGKLPPACYKDAPKQVSTLKGRAVMGWSKGSETVKRPFNNSIVVVGYQKGAKQDLVFYISPTSYYKSSQVFVSSYQRIRESVEYCFHMTYAVHLIK